MRENRENEIKVFAHVSMVVTITVFSVILLVLNLVMGWEKWVDYLLVVVPVFCLTIHIKRYAIPQVRMNIYSVFLLVELFYFTYNAIKFFDCTPAIIIIMILFALGQAYGFLLLALVIGYFGMILNLYNAGVAGTMLFDTESLVRIVFHLVIVPVSGIFLLSSKKAIRRLLAGYEDRISSLREQNRSANDFLANVSHEIRTPINAVVGLTGVCIEKEDNEEIKRDLAAVVSAGHRVSDQISDILDYSEIDMNRLVVNEEDYTLASVLKDLVNKLDMYKKQEVELVIDVDPAIPAVLHSDVNKIRKILWHLVSNGIKYTEEGGVYLRLYPTPQDYGINLNIDVTDTGHGMQEDELERVFECFYQANSGRNRISGGLGLGLSVVAGFVRELGGFVTIDSQYEKGTSVHVSLPQMVSDSTECMMLENHEKLMLGSYLHFERFGVPQVRELYSNMLRNTVRGLKVQMHKVESIESLKKLTGRIPLTHLFVGESEYTSDPAFLESLTDSMTVLIIADDSFKLPPGSKIHVMRKPFYCFPVIDALNRHVANEHLGEKKLVCPGVRALVVDDERLNLTVAQGIFKQYGMIVRTAGSGTEAIDLCEKHDFDIIFMDHMMPGMDGIETAKRIRLCGNEKNRDIPVVALTANATSAAKELFMSEGFSGFVSKPVELIELEHCLKKALPAKLIRMEVQEKQPEPVKESITQAQPSANETSDFDGLLEKAGIDTKSGRAFVQNDDDFYRTILQQFYEDHEEKKNKLCEYRKAADFKNYTILAHAVKSTAKTIGASELSEQARLLEQAGKDEDEEYITSHHEAMLKAYEVVAAAIGEALGCGSPIGDEEEEEDDEIFFFAPEGGEDA